jgi:hypothetical protein
MSPELVAILTAASPVVILSAATFEPELTVLSKVTTSEFRRLY